MVLREKIALLLCLFAAIPGGLIWAGNVDQGYCDFGFKPDNNVNIWQKGQDLRRGITSYNNLLFGKDVLVGTIISQEDLNKWALLFADIRDYLSAHNQKPESVNLKKMMIACTEADYQIMYCLGVFAYSKDKNACMPALAQAKKNLEAAMGAMCAESFILKKDTKRVLRGVLYHLAVALLTTIEKIEREVKAY